jgi:uncharacterized protein (DUF2225 family)
VSQHFITCPVCGTSFDPEGRSACQACPLQHGCELVRCPQCGFETVDPQQSSLVRFTQRLFSKKEKDTGQASSRQQSY